MQDLKTRAENIDGKGSYFEQRMCSKYFLNVFFILYNFM